jgi:integrase
MDISRAGWKDPMLDGKYFMHAYWFPTDLGRLFLHLWTLYLHQIVRIDRHHPYAFIVQNGASAGEVYSIAGYKQAHARAVQRIGLVPARSDGATPHAHRHAYGRRLMRAGIDPILRRKALHHKSLASQAVYTVPNATDVTKALNAAQTALERHAADGRIVKPGFDMARLLAFGFEDIDPDGLLSGQNPKLMNGI